MRSVIPIVVGTPMIAAGISKKGNRFIKLDSLPQNIKEINTLHY
jgi:hypothetical protein